MAEEGQMTAAEMLQQVNEAITKVLIGGQSYQIGSRKLTRADLSMLRTMKFQSTFPRRERQVILLERYISHRYFNPRSRVGNDI